MAIDTLKTKQIPNPNPNPPRGRERVSATHQPTAYMRRAPEGEARTGENGRMHSTPLKGEGVPAAKRGQKY